MRSDYIYPILIFIPLAIIQTTVIPLISINGYVPDLILILLVLYTLKEGQMYGMILGFVLGFFFDLATGNVIGSTMLSKTVAGFVAGYFANENKLTFYLKSYPFILIVLLCAIIDPIIFSFFSAGSLNTNIFKLFFEQGLIPGFYTAFVSVLVILFYPKRSIG
ncbi:MAG: rod shape-determining protein MreD [Bacteroidota bacterium]|nr:rod shape-determining protein MreD [Bacteroidota bacterium]